MSKVVGIIIVVVLALALFAGFIYVLYDMELTTEDYSKCIETYPLDSCELYSCRANNSNIIPTRVFNMRNYEVCKIILNNQMSFNESLGLLEVITYDN